MSDMPNPFIRQVVSAPASLSGTAVESEAKSSSDTPELPAKRALLYESHSAIDLPPSHDSAWNTPADTPVVSPVLSPRPSAAVVPVLSGGATDKRAPLEVLKQRWHDDVSHTPDAWKAFHAECVQTARAATAPESRRALWLLVGDVKGEMVKAKQAATTYLGRRDTLVGAGMIHGAVYRGTFVNPTKGTRLDGVFKEHLEMHDRARYPIGAVLSGIDLARSSNRSRAVYKIAKLLGIASVLKTVFAQLVDDPTLRGVAMGYVVGGVAPAMLSEAERRVLYTNPHILRDVSNLQLLDIITGQMDRHWYNILLTSDGAFGIDNDFAFGVKETGTQRSSDHSHSKGMPQWVDAEVGSRTLACTGDDIREQLYGLLAPREVEQTVARLRVTQAYVQQQTCVKDWGSLSLADFADAPINLRHGKNAGEIDGVLLARERNYLY